MGDYRYGRRAPKDRIQQAQLDPVRSVAVWAVHLSLFIGTGFASAIGQAIVLQNFIGCLFNSHLSTVTQGTLYCLAVGLLGGIVQRTLAKPEISPVMIRKFGAC